MDVNSGMSTAAYEVITACKIRRDMASENLAGIRLIAMNIQKSETSLKLLSSESRKRQQ